MRRYGLGKLVIHTAGTRNAVVEIPGLEYDDAARIRDQLMAAHAPRDAAPTAPFARLAPGPSAQQHPS